MRTLCKAACLSMICLPGCIIVTNRYSLFDFDKLRQASTVVNGPAPFWIIACAIGLSLLVLTAIAFTLHRILRWKPKRQSD